MVGAWKRSLAQPKELPRSVRIVLVRDLPTFSIFVFLKPLLLPTIEPCMLLKPTEV